MRTGKAKATATANAKDAKGRNGAPRELRGGGDFWVSGDPEAVRPLVRGEGMPVFVAGVLLALVALSVCYRHGYTLLYGDAVAHLGNARRILDSRYPGVSQLGGVWLPLPHLLMLPFVMNMGMWQSGLAAAPMSMVSFAASVVGVWRLSRRMMRLRWALVATTFYGLNPNLLYSATTALTEPLFLALFVWSAVGAVEGAAALRVGNAALAGRRMVFAGIMVLGEVFTRYDGWVMGALVWCVIAWAVWRCEAGVRRRVLPAFGVFTTLCVVGPLLWFWYNAHFDGDWLDFLRGPYSAKAIERKTSHGTGHYPGWHNPVLALGYYARAAQVCAAVWELGFGVMAAALWGAWVSWQRSGVGAENAASRSLPAGAEAPGLGASIDTAEAVPLRSEMSRELVAGAGVSRAARWGRGEGLTLLLWAPLPFYGYSVAFGAVPIFIPQLAPHAFYNARYGMELLPAMCVYLAVAAEWVEVWLRAKPGSESLDPRHPVQWKHVAARFWQPVAMVGCVLNSVLMMAGFGSAGFLRGETVHQRLALEAFRGGYVPAARRWSYPVVLQEGLVNAQTRVPFEQSLARALEQIPAEEPVLMSVTAHVGAVQDAGRTLKSMVSEGDETSWEAALADPAHHAAYVVAMEGDPVAKAVAEHPAGLAETEVIRSSGQPTTRVYQSSVWKP